MICQSISSQLKLVRTVLFHVYVLRHHTPVVQNIVLDQVSIRYETELVNINPTTVNNIIKILVSMVIFACVIIITCIVFLQHVKITLD